MQFAQDKNQRALLISKIDHRVKDGDEDDQIDGGQPKAEAALVEDGESKTEAGELLQGGGIKFSLKIQYYGPLAHTIAFLKREAFAVLDLRGGETGDHVSKQLQLLNLGYIGEDFNIFELAATYVEYSLLPLFNSYKATKSTQSDKSGSTSAGFENIQKNLAQLKVHLVQCQQNIIVPEIELIHDPEIRAKSEECKALKRDMTTDDFENSLKDPGFITRLEKTVT